jgi:mannosyltransferase OCH1-like enzyme
MPCIIERNINLNKLIDSKHEDIPTQFGYHNLQFSYERIRNYDNSVKLPKILHFIWIGNLIHQKYIDTVVNCKKINETFETVLWVDHTSVNEEVVAYLEQNNVVVRNIYDYLAIENMLDMGKLVQDYLLKNNNFGFQADVIRLYVLYVFGGIYSDIDSVWINPLDDNFDHEFVTYRVDPHCSNCTNSFMGFNRKSHFIKACLVNLRLTIECFLTANNPTLFQKFIPVISGPQHITRILKEMKIPYLNYIHQGYCVIGGPHEGGEYDYFSKHNKCYCYQTFDKNWC